MTTTDTPAPDPAAEAAWRDFWDDFRMPRPGEVERWQRDCRIMGVAVGQAVGDALGSPSEFRQPPPFGTATFGRGTFGHGVAQWTDDSEQLVVVLRARSDPRKVAEGLLEWFEGHPRDIGSQTRQVLGRCRTYAGMVASARAYAKRAELGPRPRTWDPGSGNGGIMRVSAVCLPFLGDRVKVAEMARKVTALTHASEWDQDGAMVWSLLVESAIVRDGEHFGLAAAVESALEFVAPARREVWATLAEVALRAGQPGRRLEANGSGFGAFFAALWSVARSSSYEETVQRAICLCGHDTDTVAAIAGGLAGAIYGVLEIPSKYCSRIWGWPGMNAHSLATLALEAAAR